MSASASVANKESLLFEELIDENPEYLANQLITYIGNKRALLNFINKGLSIVKGRLGKQHLDTFDVFSGSGIVSRFLKMHSDFLVVNDLENYAEIINRCYLTNIDNVSFDFLKKIYSELTAKLNDPDLEDGIISKNYAPIDDRNIQKGERVFYTKRNAKYIDTARKLINKIDPDYQHFFLAPLLSEASIHANTSGVFKGFYKSRETGVGSFGGTNGDALVRIKGNIELKLPVFSNFNCRTLICKGDSNIIAERVPEVDLAYLDPPYNQHPYGSNYFMLNIISDYKNPESISKVSGIPDDWNRSPYNKRIKSYNAFADLVKKLKAKFLLISFNSEGFIPLEMMTGLLESIGRVTILETKYNTFRGSRNLGNREIHVKEYLYVVEKS